MTFPKGELNQNNRPRHFADCGFNIPVMAFAR